MRKWIVGLVGLAVAVGSVCTVNNVSVEKASAAGAQIMLAEYVSEEHAPQIDGVIDAVWGHTNAADTNRGTTDTYGYVSILWNETGLYFLAEIDDTSVNVSDVCNLWVSETYYDEIGNEIYPEVDGAYYLVINSEGDLQYWQADGWTEGVDMRGHCTIAGGQMKDDDGEAYGYVFEVYVPLTGGSALELHRSIGFEVSVDSYLAEKVNPGVEDRAECLYWNGGGKYWELPSALGEVILVDEYETDGVYNVGDNNDSSSADSATSSDTTSEDSVTSSNTENNTTSENNENNETSSVASGLNLNCFSGLVAIPAGAITLLSVLVLAKKKKED